MAEARRDLEARLLEFAARIVKLTDALPRRRSADHIGGQLLRSGTSIGANYAEARAAESRSDLSHKLKVCLKESRETVYWLALLEKSELIEAARIEDLIDESRQLRAILTVSVRKVAAPLRSGRTR